MCVPNMSADSIRAGGWRADRGRETHSRSLSDAEDSGHDVRDRLLGANVVDLTQPFRAGFPVSAFESPSCEPLHLEDVPGYHNQRWTFTEHSGTHVDAPAHLIAGGATADTMPIEDFFLPLAVIDIRAKVEADSDALLEVDDLIAYEDTFGEIGRGSAVALQAGWDIRAADQDRWLNPDASGTFHFPGFSLESARWLEARSVKALATDTTSTDPGESATYPVHYFWLGTGGYQIEGLAHLDRVPPAGAQVAVGLPPFVGGSGGPCRVLARY